MSGNSLAAGLGASRTRRAVAMSEARLVNFLTAELVLVVTTQKLAIPLAGRESQISLAFLIHFGFLAVWALSGVLLVSRRRLVLLCAFAALAAYAQLPFVGPGWSLPSMVLMLATSAMFVFVLPIGPAGYRSLLDRFVLVALGAAVFVGVDWLFQLAGHPMPNLEALIPEAINYYQYNYIQPVQWGSPWMKPNGLFFLETSHVSQFLGIGLVIELALFRRFAMVVVLGGALLSTAGVTGLLLVATSLPFLLLRLRPTTLLGVLIALPILLLGTSQGGLLDGFTRRTAEFSQGNSSGYNRFVLPAEWSLAAFDAPAGKALFGTGAGSMPKAINDDETGSVGYAWPPYTKVGVEYGALVLIVWLMFLFSSLFASGAPTVVAWAAFAQYNFLNGSLNVPIHTVYCVLLCAGYAFGDKIKEKLINVVE